MRRSYFYVKENGEPGVRSFRSLKDAFLNTLETLTNNGRTHYSYTRHIKFVVNNGRYDTELSYQLVKDLAYDLDWFQPEKKEHHGRYHH